MCLDVCILFLFFFCSFFCFVLLITYVLIIRLFWIMYFLKKVLFQLCTKYIVLVCVCDDHTPRYSWIKFDKCSYGNRVCVSSYKCFQTLHSSYYMIGYVFSQWIHMLVDRVILCVWKKKLNFIVLINQRWFLCVSSLRFTHTVD